MEFLSPAIILVILEWSIFHKGLQVSDSQLLPFLKATPNNFLDSHPNFVKNWGGWEVFIFYFSYCFNEQDKGLAKALIRLHVCAD